MKTAVKSPNPARFDPEPLVGITLSVVALSVTLHGITSPLLDFYEKAATRAKLRKTHRALRDKACANPV